MQLKVRGYLKGYRIRPTHPWCFELWLGVVRRLKHASRRHLGAFFIVDGDPDAMFFGVWNRQRNHNRTIEGWTPLMIAGGGGRLGVVKVLLEAGAAIHDKDDEFGSNSFMWACGGGHAEIVRYGVW